MCRLLGYLGYNRAKKALDRFDVVALGDYREKGTDPRTLGVCLEFARQVFLQPLDLGPQRALEVGLSIDSDPVRAHRVRDRGRSPESR